MNIGVFLFCLHDHLYTCIFYLFSSLLIRTTGNHDLAMQLLKAAMAGGQGQGTGEGASTNSGMSGI